MMQRDLALTPEREEKSWKGDKDLNREEHQ